MKKRLVMLLMGGSIFFAPSVFAQEFYSVIYPIKSFVVKAAASGEVVFVDKRSEKTNIKEETIIKLDDSVDRIELEQTKIKLANLKEIYAIESETLESYNRVSSKTKIEKDAQRIKILNMSSSIADMEIRIATLSRNIENKTITPKNTYLSSIEVEVGDYVNLGTVLYKGYDLSKGKLEVFLPINEIESFKNKTIYLNGTKTNLRINKISRVADEKNISAYKAEIIVNNPRNFSKLTKVEFR